MRPNVMRRHINSTRDGTNPDEHMTIMLVVSVMVVIAASNFTQGERVVTSLMLSPKVEL